MFINYLFRCQEPDCGYTEDFLVDKQDKDLLLPCPYCLKDSMTRTFSVPNIRTEKLSKSYLDKTSIGGGRPASQGFDDFKRIAELEVEKVKHRPNSEKRIEIEKEISDRKKIKL